MVNKKAQAMRVVCAFMNLSKDAAAVATFVRAGDIASMGKLQVSPLRMT